VSLSELLEPGKKNKKLAFLLRGAYATIAIIVSPFELLRKLNLINLLNLLNLILTVAFFGDKDCSKIVGIIFSAEFMV
jgi:hypothetical protein